MWSRKFEIPKSKVHEVRDSAVVWLELYLKWLALTNHVKIGSDMKPETENRKRTEQTV
jgi:hypothetical protein